MASSLSFIKCTNLFKIQGPKVSNMTRIKSRPSRVEIKVVSQGHELNQDSNEHWWASHSLLCLASPSLTLAMDTLTTPEWSTQKQHSLPSTAYSPPCWRKMRSGPHLFCFTALLKVSKTLGGGRRGVLTSLDLNQWLHADGSSADSWCEGGSPCPRPLTGSQQYAQGQGCHRRSLNLGGGPFQFAI